MHGEVSCIYTAARGGDTQIEIYKTPKNISKKLKHKGIGIVYGEEISIHILAEWHKSYHLIFKFSTFLSWYCCFCTFFYPFSQTFFENFNQLTPCYQFFAKHFAESPPLPPPLRKDCRRRNNDNEMRTYTKYVTFLYYHPFKLWIESH